MVVMVTSTLWGTCGTVLRQRSAALHAVSLM